MATLKQYNLCGHIASKSTENTDIVEEYEQSSTTVLVSYECFWENENQKLVLYSYVVKTKNTGLQNILLLSSVQFLLRTMKDDEKKKLTIYKLYDFTNSGIDVWTNKWQLLVAKQSQIDGQ